MSHAAGGPAEHLIGAALGKDYRVVDQIGAGGMGRVYLVEHTALRKRFAAKVLSHELADDDEARARFVAEAHAASRLEHENIVTITDFGVMADGRPYLVMEYLRGLTLAERLDEGPLALEEIVAIVVPVARALSEAHAEGIVHRDVKPENVFLATRGGGRWTVKVLDFGIAKTPVRDIRLTRDGRALGSPMYMAPEACRGDDIDHRADIYSLGILMYLLWCGRVPFEDENLLRVLHMQVHDPVPPPRELNPDVPPAIEAVILGALAKDRDRRFLSIAMLLAALEEALPPGAERLLVESARGTSTLRVPTERAGALAATPAPTRAPAAVDGVASAPSAPAPTRPEPPSAAEPPPRAPRRTAAVIGALALAGLIIAIVAIANRSDHRPGATATHAVPSAPAPGSTGSAAGPVGVTPTVTPATTAPPGTAATAAPPPTAVTAAAPPDAGAAIAAPAATATAPDPGGPVRRAGSSRADRRRSGPDRDRGAASSPTGDRRRAGVDLGIRTSR
jgi:serine/threonine-protein kinase